VAAGALGALRLRQAQRPLRMGQLGGLRAPTMQPLAEGVAATLVAPVAIFGQEVATMEGAVAAAPPTSTQCSARTMQQQGSLQHCSLPGPKAPLAMAAQWLWPPTCQ
jgi:hypothetical protein